MAVLVRSILVVSSLALALLFGSHSVGAAGVPPVPAVYWYSDVHEVGRFSHVAFGPAVAVAAPVVVDFGAPIGSLTLLGVGRADPCEAYASYPCHANAVAAPWYARPAGVGEPAGFVLYSATLHVDINQDGFDDYVVPGATYAIDLHVDANGDGFDEASHTHAA